MTDDLDPLHAELLGQTARAPWRELQRFFANGSAMAVAPELDLVQVAAAVARDDAATVRPWVEAGQVGPVSDAQARAWHAADATLWTVVVRPLVLVQPDSGEVRRPGA